MITRRTTIAASIASLAVAGGIAAAALVGAGTATAGTPIPAPAIAAAAVSTTGPAAPSTTAPAKPLKGQPLVRAACRQLTRQAKRDQRVITRLSSSTATKGSIASTEANAAKAQKAGHADLAKKLTARANTRQTELATLKQIESGVQGVTTSHCG